VCFAHFGGVKEILKGDGSYYETVKDLMYRFPRVYADLSFTSTDDKCEEALTVIGEDIMRDNIDPSKILFGTDYWMIVAEGSIEACVKNYTDYVAPMSDLQVNNRRWIYGC
jgi:predicted TIM-barrel fold metal-dependent hydrolase